MVTLLSLLGSVSPARAQSTSTPTRTFVGAEAMADGAPHGAKQTQPTESTFERALGERVPLWVPVRTEVRLLLLRDALLGLSGTDDQRVRGGVSRLVAGAAFGVLAALFPSPEARSTLSVGSSLFVLTGITMLSLRSQAHFRATEYVEAPSATPSEVRSKVLLGETHLRALARFERRKRWVHGSLAMLGAAALVPTYVLLQRAEHETYRFGALPFDVVSTVMSASGFASALVMACLRSPAERLLARYETRRAMFERESPHELERLQSQVQLNLGAAPHALMLQAAWNLR